jgi:threonine synthase
VHRYGREGRALAAEGETAAEGIRVIRPMRGDAVLSAVVESGGDLVAVDEPAIQAGRNALARLGFYVESTSAVVWEALRQILEAGSQASPAGGDIVVMLTGSGLKNSVQPGGESGVAGRRRHRGHAHGQRAEKLGSAPITGPVVIPTQGASAGSAQESCPADWHTQLSSAEEAPACSIASSSPDSER